MGDKIVELRGLSRSFNVGKEIIDALCDIHLSIQSQEMVAIIGPSGSGKSTLMHHLGCLEKLQKGKYLLDGQDVGKMNDDSLSLLRASKIGFIFQSFNLISHLTVYENVSLPFHYYPQGKSDEAVIDALKLVDLKHRANHVPRELSGGEMQRVAIARAIAINPVLILADEPTGSLDSGNREGILSLLKTLNNQGSTIIIVTHDETVAKQCKRIITMQDGKIVEETKLKS